MTEQLQLELGRSLRDRGMALAELAAGERFRLIGRAIILGLAAKGEPFNADDVRRELELREIPVEHPNAVGGLFASASRAKVIERVGYRQTTSVTQHAHTHPLWKGAA